ncbi:calcium-binding protein [Skermanella aerolata]|uniref:Calcium-binding protein n=1 Tax=Skermanella aerolata TaxID=393310 RepID=A0A512E2W1_9PROT|nr:calcium-binding protein [Skermanella aerolata]KJB89900.1 hypothetical protein N826_10940 [Skermanella aerolata KACC 11604]GEO43037.1 calcium-binding protein [Skermanella aerolata]
MSIIKGSRCSDTLVGTTGDDQIYGFSGNDRLYGLAGADRLFGGCGRDFLSGGAGNERLNGGGGCDVILGGKGNDTLWGGPGNDRLDGGGMGSTIDGGSGNDRIAYDVGGVNVYDYILYHNSSFHGGPGRDTLVVTNIAFTKDWSEGAAENALKPADILIWGGGHPDSPISDMLMTIGSTADTLEDLSGVDAFLYDIERIVIRSDASHKLIYMAGGPAPRPMTVVGGDGDDRFVTGPANEVLEGGKGNDTFWVSNNGHDRLISNPDDADHFTFNSFDPSVAEIEGFNGQGRAGGDRIDFFGTDVTVTERADGTTLFDWGNGQAIVDAVGLVANQDYFLGV